MIKQNALVVVDAQRGFMPAEEGERLNMEGFGELAVPGGDKVVHPINTLSHTFRSHFLPIATTQDWHPETTAHFAAENEEPNYVNTWPPHCRANTPGAELHPDLYVARYGNIYSTRFIKGDVAAETPADDTSYTGALAYNPETNTTLPDWLKERRVSAVYVVGLALGDGAENKLCVDSTAADLNDLGFEVALVTDAAEAVLPENREKCFKNLGKAGVRLVTTAEAMAEVNALYGEA